VDYGVKGGLNRSTFNGNSNWTTQYAVGGFVEFQFAAISIQPEILYSVKGDKSNEDQSYITNTPPYSLIYYTIVHTNTITYLDFPVLIKFHLHLPAVMSSIYIGPSFGFLLGANDHAEGFGSTTNTDKKNIFPQHDIGLVLGTGIDIPYRTFKITFDARYDFGLSNLDSIVGVFNRVFSIYVGIKL
jgi:hypothetical protein